MRFLTNRVKPALKREHGSESRFNRVYIAVLLFSALAAVVALAAQGKNAVLTFLLQPLVLDLLISIVLEYRRNSTASRFVR